MKRLSQKERRERRFQFSIQLVVAIFLLLAFIPIFLMILMSLKTNWDIIYDFFSFPKQIAWENYSKAFSVLATNLWNTLFVVAAAVVLTLVLSTLSGFVFATMRFPGKNFLFLSLLVLLMIPGVLSLASNYNLILEYGLYNTRWALILPWISGGQVLGIILCRNTIESLPQDLFEAAKIDGCSAMNSLIRIALPLCKPILATIAVMKLVDYYNDFIWPMMVIESNSKQVITVAVRVFTAAQGTINIGSMFAGYVIATIPLLILFMFGSRLYMEGLTAGALKG